MRRYKGKHNDELFSLIDDIDESLGENNSFNSYHNPSALTPEEVLAQNAASEADNEPTGALEALKKRMLSSQQQDTPEKAPQKTPEAPKVPEAPKTEAAPIQTPAAPEAVQGGSSDSLFDFDFFDLTASNGQNAENRPEPEKKEKSLLEKCRPFIIDDEGHDSAMKDTPAYRLESVADILSSESHKTLDRLSQKYDIEFDDLGHNKSQIPESAPKASEREVFEEKMPDARDIQTNVPLHLR